MFDKLISFFIKKMKKNNVTLDLDKPIEVKKVLEDFITPENLEKEITEDTPKMDAKPKRKSRKKKDEN
jgi:hypothetical protein